MGIFISHPAKGGTERAIQIKSRHGGTIAGSLPRKGLRVWPVPLQRDYLSKNQAKKLISLRSLPAIALAQARQAGL